MTANNTPDPRQELINSYNLRVGGIEGDALGDDNRAYGGVIRADKGKLVEEMSSHIIRLAWQKCCGPMERLSFGDVKTYKIPAQKEYIDRLPENVRSSVKNRLKEHFYRAKVDRHVFIDGNFVMGVECKSYTENAMLKRILVDFRLLKSLHPDLVCCLLQLESSVGGDYSRPLAAQQ